nr:MAG TPA: hypothetical protein [Caudoviricetes sp.]
MITDAKPYVRGKHNLFVVQSGSVTDLNTDSPSLSRFLLNGLGYFYGCRVNLYPVQGRPIAGNLQFVKTVRIHFLFNGNPNKERVSHNNCVHSKDEHSINRPDDFCHRLLYPHSVVYYKSIPLNDSSPFGIGVGALSHAKCCYNHSESTCEHRK